MTEHAQWQPCPECGDLAEWYPLKDKQPDDPRWYMRCRDCNVEGYVRPAWLKEETVDNPSLRKLGFFANFRGAGDSQTDVRWQYDLVGRHLSRLGFALVHLANRLRVGPDAPQDCGHSEHTYGVGTPTAGRRRRDGEWEFCTYE